MMSEDKEISVNRPYDKWFILFIGCMLAAGGIGIYNTFSVFTAPICDALSVSSASFGMLSSIRSISSGLLSLCIPWFIRKFGIRKSIIAGYLITVVSFVLNGFANDIFQLYLSGALYGAGYTMAGMTVLFSLINPWFEKNHGVISSVMMCTAGIMGAVFSPVLSSVIEKSGWRNGEFLTAAVILVSTLPVILYTRALVPNKKNAETAGTEGKKEDENVLVPDLLNQIPVILSFSLCCYYICVVTYFTKLAAFKGLSASEGAMLISMTMVGNILSKFVYGFLSDRIGPIRTGGLIFALNGAAALGMIFSDSGAVLAAMALLFGSFYSITGLGGSLMAKRLFGNDGFVPVFSRMTTASMLTGALMTPVVGRVIDRTGSCDIPLWSVVACDAFCLVLVWIMERQSRIRKEES